MIARVPLWCLCLAALQISGCGYRHVAGPLRPAAESAQVLPVEVQDDGTVIFRRDRLEVSIRPMTDAELNRQFPVAPGSGEYGTNPYTYGDWVDPKTGDTPSRFTVFHVNVKNYSFPKVLVDPAHVRIHTDVGRVYEPIAIRDLDEYFLAYAVGYAGNEHRLYKSRRDVLRRTMYSSQLVFSGQENDGYLVFPTLHHAVSRLRVTIDDVVVRFDYRDEPMESLQLEYVFERDITKSYSSTSSAPPSQPGAGSKRL